MIQRLRHFADGYRRSSVKGLGLYALEIKSTGEFIGYVGLHEIGFDADFTPGVEIGWRLAADYHNQGYATEAAKAVLSLAKSAGIERLFSFTAKINAPSERVMQKIGMVKAGEFRHPNLSDDSPLCVHVLYKIDLYKRANNHDKNHGYSPYYAGSFLLFPILLFSCFYFWF